MVTQAKHAFTWTIQESYVLLKSPLPRQFAGKSLAPNLPLQSGACVAKTMMPWLCQHPDSDRHRHPGLLEMDGIFGGWTRENLGQRDLKLQTNFPTNVMIELSWFLLCQAGIGGRARWDKEYFKGHFRIL